MRKPDFLILGAAKCGTTSLYIYLNTHPEICMSDPKEPLFFEAEYHKGFEYYYNKYFLHCRGERIIGEARHRNLYLPYVAERIGRSVPNAKLIVIVRNPVDRAYSHWWHWYSRGREPLSFRDAIYEDIRRIESGITFEGEEGAQLWERNFDFEIKRNEFRTYVDSGYYSQQIRRYLKHFPEDHLKVIFMEDLVRNPQAIMLELYSFLGVKAADREMDFKPHNVALGRTALRLMKHVEKFNVHNVLPHRIKNIGKKLLYMTGATKKRIDPSTKKVLIDHYYPYNRDLEKLTGRDLSHWDV